MKHESIPLLTHSQPNCMSWMWTEVPSTASYEAQHESQSPPVTAISHLIQSHPVSTHGRKVLASHLAVPSVGLLGTEGVAAHLSVVDAEASTELLAEHPVQWRCHHISSPWVFLNKHECWCSELLQIKSAAYSMYGCQWSVTGSLLVSHMSLWSGRSHALYLQMAGTPFKAILWNTSDMDKDRWLRFSFEAGMDNDAVNLYDYRPSVVDN